MKYLRRRGRSSLRRACLLLGMSRSVVGYVARRRRGETMLVKKIHELAVRNGRYGYRRVAVLLRREGWKVNRKRVHRIWKSEGLGLPRRRPKRRGWAQWEK